MLSDSQLKSFISYGNLPLIGRLDLIKQAKEFIEKTSIANHLRLCLITGEAGVGKSSFVRILLEELSKNKIIALHLKFYPESESSLLTLISNTINSESTLHLIRSSPSNNLSEIIQIIRKLSRIKITTLVIEDVNLMNKNSQSELVQIMDALSDESFSIVLISRPIGGIIRSIIEIYLEDEIKIHGLSMLEIIELWKLIFDTNPIDSIIESLYYHTKGNALVLRSSLRALIKENVISLQANGWFFEDDYEKCNSIIMKCAKSVCDGILLTLNNSELSYLKTLASLGELFSIEAANILIGDDSKIINTLVDNGIIVESHYSVRAISGSTNSIFPTYAFSNSIVYESMQHLSTFNSKKYTSIICNNLPIYSFIYFENFLKINFNELDINDLILTFENILDIHATVAQTSENKYSQKVFNCAKKILKYLKVKIDVTVYNRMEAALKCGYLFSIRESIAEDEYLKQITELVDSTKNFETIEEGDVRLNALLLYVYSKNLISSKNNSTPENYSLLSEFKNVLDIITKFPDLRYSDNYISCLDGFLAIALDLFSIKNNIEIIKVIENQFNLLSNDYELELELREGLLKTVGGSLLLVEVNSISEINKKKELLKRLEQIKYLPVETIVSMVRFLIRIGEIKKGVELLQRAEIESNKISHNTSIINCKIYRIFSNILLNENIENVESLCLDFINTYPNEKQNLFILLIYGVNFRLDKKKLVNLLEKIDLNFDVNIKILPIEMRILYYQIIENYFEINKIVSENSNNQLCDILEPIKNNKTFGENESVIIKFLIVDNLTLRTVSFKISVIRYLLYLKDTSETIKSKIKDTLTSISIWFLDRELFEILRVFIKEFERYINSLEVNLIGSELQKIYKSNLTLRNQIQNNESKLRVSVLGEFSIALPLNQYEKVRGERIKNAIGAIVANQMLSKKLSLDDFNTLVTEEINPSIAKSLMRKVRFRLREIVNEKYFEQVDSEPINFKNTEVNIDLIDAQLLLKNALKLFKQNNLINSGEQLIKLFEIVKDHVPFPGLYSDFYESLREDWENAIRDATLMIGKKLLEEEYLSIAEELFYKSIILMPDDDELVFYLERILTLQNRQAEAEIIRNKI